MPKEAVLQIDFTKMTLAEQTTAADPLTMLQGGGEITPVGIYSAINAINAAAQDPAIRYIYMKKPGSIMNRANSTTTEPVSRKMLRKPSGGI
jgi:hypothetical protein